MGGGGWRTLAAVKAATSYPSLISRKKNSRSHPNKLEWPIPNLEKALEESSYVEGTEPLIVPVLREEKRQMDLRREAFMRSWALPDLVSESPDTTQQTIMFMLGLLFITSGVGVFWSGAGCEVVEMTWRHGTGALLLFFGAFFLGASLFGDPE